MIPDPKNWTPKEVVEYALSFDGYVVFGDRCGDMANKVESAFRDSGRLPTGLTLDELRNALFFLVRADRHGGGDFEDHPEQVAYVTALLQKISTYEDRQNES